MLIRNAEIAPGAYADVHVAQGRIRGLRGRGGEAAAGAGLGAPPLAAAAPGLRAGARVDAPAAGENASGCARPHDGEDRRVIDAGGCALLPGLHDHHLHLRALAAALDSVPCGPPAVSDHKALAAALKQADRRLEAGEWLRGIGYHDSVAGPLSRALLDTLLPDRPLRIQHRSGRLWVLNSAALEALAPERDAPLERSGGRWTGRLLDADDWLARRPGRAAPSLAAASRRLAAYGITGVTDTTHHNGLQALAGLADAQARGELLQKLRVMGNAELDRPEPDRGRRLQRGEHKFHLHEHALPDFDALCAAIRASHAAGRGCAFHCVTRTELVYATAALGVTGVARDRIEHAAVAPPELAQEMAALGLTVVTQPGFVRERGASYRREVAAEDQRWLYRLRGLREAGVGLALSSDAPFTSADPWQAMEAAVTRRVEGGGCLGVAEALSPEQALAGYLAPLEAPGGEPRRIAPGAPADLCLLDRPWRRAREALSAVRVRLTLIEGVPVFDAGDARSAAA